MDYDGVLIAEFDDEGYEVLALAGSRAEAQELADHDMAKRMRELEAETDTACPSTYRLWVKNSTGAYEAHEIEA